MLSYSGNCHSKACGLHVHRGNGFTVTGPGGSEPSKSQIKDAKKMKCCSPSSECGSHANGYLAFKEKGFRQENQTQLCKVLDHRNL